MPPEPDHELRRGILRVLGREAGPDAPAAAIAAAAVRLHERLARQLTPLIGEAAVAALSSRVVHRARPEFPWLLGDADESAPQLSQLGLCLQRQPAAVATAAVTALLANFHQLLVTLIGDGLTTRLVREAWPDIVSDDTAQERSR